MARSGKINVALPAEQVSHIRRIVEAGEFASAADVVREALRSWLQRRKLHGGRHVAARLGRSLEARRDASDAPFERVELLFDAGDASGG